MQVVSYSLGNIYESLISSIYLQILFLSLNISDILVRMVPSIHLFPYFIDNLLKAFLISKELAVDGISSNSYRFCDAAITIQVAMKNTRKNI